jgi:pyridoxamine 5'-phosphate oxidase
MMIEPAVPLLEDTVDPDPLDQFHRWFDEAAKVTEAPEAMAVATADAGGRPSVRMVLLKAWGPDGFVFFTNYDSRKGRELAVNPRASLLFNWEATSRQVRIEGPAERTSDGESDAYFATRPRGSQIGALASHQSQTVAGRDELDRRVEAVIAEYGDGPIPRPPWWGGVRVTPLVFEFWQHRDNRLHDRLRYTPDDRGWQVQRLQP